MLRQVSKIEFLQIFQFQVRFLYYPYEILFKLYLQMYFRYAGGFSSVNNCLLSSIRIEDVDYVSDQDWDLYEIQQNLCPPRNNQGSGGLTQQQTLQGRCTKDHQEYNCVTERN